MPCKESAISAVTIANKTCQRDCCMTAVLHSCRPHTGACSPWSSATSGTLCSCFVGLYCARHYVWCILGPLVLAWCHWWTRDAHEGYNSMRLFVWASRLCGVQRLYNLPLHGGTASCCATAADVMYVGCTLQRGFALSALSTLPTSLSRGSRVNEPLVLAALYQPHNCTTASRDTQCFGATGYGPDLLGLPWV